MKALLLGQYPNSPMRKSTLTVIALGIETVTYLELSLKETP